MKMHVYIKDPGKPPRSVNISKSLKNLQNTVGGHIECVRPLTDMVIICNEEGMINDLPFNCELFGLPFFGTIIFAGANEDDFCDVPIEYDLFKKLFPSLWRC